MLIVSVLVVLGTAVAVLVVAPLIWGQHEDALPAHEPTTADLLARKAEVLAALKELEFDHRARKLSTEDYEELRTLYRVEAAEILAAVDRAADPVRDMEARIDAEVAAWRERQARGEGAAHGTD